MNFVNINCRKGDDVVPFAIKMNDNIVYAFLSTHVTFESLDKFEFLLATTEQKHSLQAKSYFFGSTSQDVNLADLRE